ncbi:hypothetical protein HYQ45_011722 [Verticillium longisporum]|uniref:Ig-like domain-containing protein n=1 Tax=Verticillium longisporum TaxID=100787 RepID=A0A0G4KFF1_VERLO|nr:hypothetical protein HYQ44_011607 [Verticillium longisporum]KAG7128897.1 hypothetical protein HYQ45_011722 [Verticillium longisporum]CRJ87205.1 hypothetical protein BN1723_000249 [Verticillium longisporum]
MKFPAVAFIAALSGSAIAAAPDGYTVTDLDWVFKTPSGESITLYGTLEEVTEEFQSLYPSTKLKRRNANSDKHELLTRQWEGASYECIDSKHPVHGWEPADYGRIQEGWNYLWDLEGQPGHGPGPAACARVSCSHNSGIYWCNDNDHAVTLNSWGDLARGAAELCNLCSSAGIRNKCGGQLFHPDGYNVFITNDSC